IHPGSGPGQAFSGSCSILNDERVVPFSASTLSTEPGSTEGGGGAGPGLGSHEVGDGHEARPQGIVPPAGAANADATPHLVPPDRSSRSVRRLILTRGPAAARRTWSTRPTSPAPARCACRPGAPR